MNIKTQQNPTSVCYTLKATLQREIYNNNNLQLKKEKKEKTVRAQINGLMIQPTNLEKTNPNQADDKK